MGDRRRRGGWYPSIVTSAAYKLPADPTLPAPAPSPDASAERAVIEGAAPVAPRRATYADLEAVPAGKVAELVDGALYVFPRPASPHAYAASGLGADLVGPFQRGRGGPGGWIILDEPEIHFAHPTHSEIEALVPDLAGWRRERMPELPDAAFMTLAPDWVCEVLSPSTRMHDRERKMQVYERHQVRWAWLVDPIERTLEVFTLAGGRWSEAQVYRGAECVRAVPFDAIELDLALLWAR
jgi:Uma2 family endonuclease